MDALPPQFCFDVSSTGGAGGDGGGAGGEGGGGGEEGRRGKRRWRLGGPPLNQQHIPPPHTSAWRTVVRFYTSLFNANGQCTQLYNATHISNA